ncbi:putative transmembrane protein [Toxoplasma gondii VAND]|uniref:Putative transmembrane protein n=2 Tax=Toxoplasma gondii TaxID=5811 RepID=A0A2G8Y6Z5_TOXGO|nr:putative transmembrane protein [Toxoplasma gondii VAND]PIM02779.1 putative transmembrane protein [Toxoplasma gondii COUG]
MAQHLLRCMRGGAMNVFLCYRRTRELSAVMGGSSKYVFQRGTASSGSRPLSVCVFALLVVCGASSLHVSSETLSNAISDVHRTNGGTFSAVRPLGTERDLPREATLSPFLHADAVTRTDSFKESHGLIDSPSGKGLGASSITLPRLRRQDTAPAAEERGRRRELAALIREKGVSQSPDAGSPAASSHFMHAPQGISFVGNMSVVKTRKKKHRGKDVTEDELRYAPTTAEEFRAGWRREEQVSDVPFCKDLGFGGFHPDDSSENYCWSRCGRSCESWMFLSQDSKSSWTLVADAKRVKPCLTPANKSHRNILCKAVRKPTSVDYVDAVRHEMDIVSPDQVPPMAIGFQGPDPRMVLQPSTAMSPAMPYYAGPEAMRGVMWAGSEGLSGSALSALPLMAAFTMLTFSVMLFG